MVIKNFHDYYDLHLFESLEHEEHLLYISNVQTSWPVKVYIQLPGP